MFIYTNHSCRKYPLTFPISHVPSFQSAKHTFLCSSSPRPNPPVPTYPCRPSLPSGPAKSQVFSLAHCLDAWTTTTTTHALPPSHCPYSHRIQYSLGRRGFFCRKCQDAAMTGGGGWGQSMAFRPLVKRKIKRIGRRRVVLWGPWGCVV